MNYTWDVQTRVIKVRPRILNQDDVLLGEEPIEDTGHRYRYVCTCGHKGPWRINGNDADGDAHLYRAHNVGD